MIDLDRLKEARDDLNRTGRDMEPLSLVVVEQAVEVLADAPTVWWCARAESALDQDDSSDRWCYDDDGFATNPHSGCGWVALVPVKGGQE